MVIVVCCCNSFWSNHLDRGITESGAFITDKAAIIVILIMVVVVIITIIASTAICLPGYTYGNPLRNCEIPSDLRFKSGNYQNSCYRIGSTAVVIRGTCKLLARLWNWLETKEFCTRVRIRIGFFYCGKSAILTNLRVPKGYSELGKTLVCFLLFR